MYGTTILATLLSIVLIGIISPAAGMLMIATSVFATLIFFRVQSLSHIPRAKYVPRKIRLTRRNPYRVFLKTPKSEKIAFSRNPYRVFLKTPKSEKIAFSRNPYRVLVTAN